jgi:hypothetical protein
MEVATSADSPLIALRMSVLPRTSHTRAVCSIRNTLDLLIGFPDPARLKNPLQFA